MNAKKEAWETLRSDCCGALGKQVTVGQLIKALNNVKSTVKKKTDLAQVPGPQFINRDDIQESLLNTETEGKPNKNEEPKSQETKKPMNNKSDADHHKNKIRKSEKIVSNHEADETKDLSTPQLQRIVLLQQYKVNKIKLEKETILFKTMKKQTVEKTTQNHRAARLLYLNLSTIKGTNYRQQTKMSPPQNFSLGHIFSCNWKPYPIM
ncbi:hypothetical protein WA026_002000 [Henosepilachna vigintioctopunctata]|uniref:Regulatory protein zeste n=1 Tax=Henosepilachna vigintioctopunctata TaxID=420089 RepID=A0AAW1UV07_9CUCU